MRHPRRCSRSSPQEANGKPTRTPQGCRNATAQFVGVMNYVFGSLNGDICVVYADDILIFAKTQQQLVQRARMALQRLHRHHIYPSAEKSIFYTTKVKWCGKLYSASGVRQDPA